MLLTLTLLSTAALAAPTFEPAPLPSTTTDVDEVASLLARGKTALIAGRFDEALTTFRAAHEKSGAAPWTEIWVLRGRIAAGELDEAFDRIVDLEASGATVEGLDYVIGVARYEMARREERQRGGSPGGAYQEAAAYLSEALAADGVSYPDGWKMLAASSRWIGELEDASKAIDRALEVSKDAETLGFAAKIRVARGAALLADEDTQAAGKRAIEQGVADATAAAHALGTEIEQAGQQADMHLQRAVGLLFLEKKADAADAYTEAMTWDPTQVDYGQLLGLYTDGDGTVGPFVEIVKGGAEGFEARWGNDINSDAGLLWWLGFGEYTLGRYDDAINSFGRAVAKYPAYANSHWYIALSQYFRGKEHDVKAAASFRRYAEEDQTGFAQMVNSSAQNKAYPGRLLGRLYAAGKFEAAADLAEVRLMADETDPLLWNDVGLMNRDAGEHVMRAKIEEPRKSAEEYYERSWAAYQVAIELDRKPQYLNDGAVLLHYYLKRDSDKAIAMYDEAEAMALKMLEKGDFASGEKPVVEIALRDSRNNRELLKRRIEREKSRKKGGDGDGERGL